MPQAAGANGYRCGPNLGMPCEAKAMPASLKRIRETMKVEPTARNKGLKLTIAVVAYDSGMIEVDGVPMASPDGPTPQKS